MTTLSDLGAVLDAPAIILTTTTLTSCSMKVGSEYGLGAIIGTIDGGMSSCLYLSNASGNDTSAQKNAESSCRPVDSPILE